MKALIGKKAPEFHAPAVVNGNEIIEDFSLEQYVGKKYVVMFFYPMDFSFFKSSMILFWVAMRLSINDNNPAIFCCSTSDGTDT